MWGDRRACDRNVIVLLDPDTGPFVGDGIVVDHGRILENTFNGLPGRDLTGQESLYESPYGKRPLVLQEQAGQNGKFIVGPVRHAPIVGHSESLSMSESG